MNSDNLEIHEIRYGGITGSYIIEYIVNKNDYESLIITGKGSDYQTYIPINDDRQLLYRFINRSFKTHDPYKKMIASCMSSSGSEYILKSGKISLRLKPDRKCDSIFQLLLGYEY